MPLKWRIDRVTVRVMNNTKSRKPLWLLNTVFILLCLAILLFLWLAPKESTAPLPVDEVHQPFHAISNKKEAERTCLDCHGQSQVAPLPATHPPPYRCLFCHKRGR